MENFLRVYTIFTDRNQIEASVRKSALEQLAMMLTDSSLHTSFLNHGGLERIVDELRSNIKRDELICSVSEVGAVMKSSVWNFSRRIIHRLFPLVQKSFDY